MALVVKNNISGLYTLNQLNKNSSALAKSLQKVSSGMQINGAGDNASAYSISEKMRARIRGLDQCNMNTVTGRNMIEVASGAVGEQLDILKKLREIALKSSDDTYAQVDRDVLQSETNHLLMELNNISYDTNYNGQQLLNGSMGFMGTAEVMVSPESMKFDATGSVKDNTIALSASSSTPVIDSYAEALSPVKSPVRYLDDLPQAAPPSTGLYYYDDSKIVSTPLSTADIHVGSKVYHSSSSDNSQYTVAQYTDMASQDSFLSVRMGNVDYVLVDSATGLARKFDSTSNTYVDASPPSGVATMTPYSKKYAPYTAYKVGDMVTTSPVVPANTNGYGSYPTRTQVFQIDQTDFIDPNLGSQRWIKKIFDWDPASAVASISSGLRGTVDGVMSKSYYKLDFANLPAGTNLPDDLHDQGISVMCSNCGQFVSLKLDKNMSAGEVNYVKGNERSCAYVIGIGGATTADAVAQAMFDAVGKSGNGYTVNSSIYVANSSDSAVVTTDHAVYINRYTDSNGKISYYLEKSSYTISVYNGFKGDIIVIPAQMKTVEVGAGRKPYQDFRIQGETKATMFTNLRFPNTTLNVLFPPEDSDFDLDPQESDYPNPWPQEYLSMSDKEKERYGEKYNCVGDEEQIRREKWRDEVWPYPRKGAVASGSCVRTREKAKKFLDDIDQAIKYVLEVSTTFGAQSQRMTMMNSNIVTGTENTQSSESVIRDADMAKEMESYTKNNVLVQSAQSMLSQSNQNTSGILSLLE